MSVDSSSALQLTAILDGPASPPPPGVMPDFAHLPIVRVGTIARMCIFIVIPTLALTMHMYTKIRIIRQVHVADHSIVLAWACFMAWIAAAWLADVAGCGVHQWNIQLRDLEPLLKDTYVAAILYLPSIFFIKLSILLQYLQIFAPTMESRTMIWSCYILIAANFMFYAATTLAAIFQCSPISRAWNVFATQGHCIDAPAVYIATGAINTLSDFVLLCLPQHAIWRLQMTRRKKLEASAAFLVGFLACVASTIRTVYAVRLFKSPDQTFELWYIGVWSGAEIAAGIVAGCLPVLRRFVMHLAKSSHVSRVRSWSKDMKRHMSLPAGSTLSDIGRSNSLESYPTERQSDSYVVEVHEYLKNNLGKAECSHAGVMVTRSFQVEECSDTESGMLPLGTSWESH